MGIIYQVFTIVVILFFDVPTKSKIEAENKKNGRS
jgi:hypothetical protein